MDFSFLNEEDDEILLLEFNFKSGLEDEDGELYYNDFNVDINIYDKNSKLQEKVGICEFYQANTELAINHNYPFLDFIDLINSEIVFLCSQIFDFETYNYKENFYKHFRDEIFLNLNFILIQRIEILPKYRGYNLTKYLIQAICNKFLAGSGVIALSSSPLQFNTIYYSKDNDWTIKMNFNVLEQNEKKANTKLKAYYKKIGFKNIRGIKDFMFYFPN